MNSYSCYLLVKDKTTGENKYIIQDHRVLNKDNSCIHFKKKLFAKKGEIVCSKCKYWTYFEKDFHLIKNATNSCEFFKKKLFAKKGKIVCKNCKHWYLPYFPL